MTPNQSPVLRLVRCADGQGSGWRRNVADRYSTSELIAVLSAVEYFDPVSLDGLVADVADQLGRPARTLVMELLEHWSVGPDAPLVLSVFIDGEERWGITELGELELQRLELLATELARESRACATEHGRRFLQRRRT